MNAANLEGHAGDTGLMSKSLYKAVQLKAEEIRQVHTRAYPSGAKKRYDSTNRMPASSSIAYFRQKQGMSPKGVNRFFTRSLPSRLEFAADPEQSLGRQ